MTEIPGFRGQRLPWQTASTSVSSSRSLTSMARCAQNFREHARRAREPPGMADDGALRALTASDFQHSHRLAHCGRAIERGDVAFRLAHGLGEGRDDGRCGVVDEILDVIDGAGDGLITGRDRKADAEATQIGKDGNADRAALGDEADVARKLLRLHDGLFVGGHARRWIENAHAVGPAHRHARVAAEAGDLVHVLVEAKTWMPPELGHARVLHYRAAIVGYTRLSLTSAGMTVLIGNASAAKGSVRR
jgi:hypothetical protein